MISDWSHLKTQQQEAKKAYDKADYDPFLLMIDNNADALEDILNYVKMGGNMAVAVQKSEMRNLLTGLEIHTVNEWLRNVVNNFTLKDYKTYWTGIQKYYEQKVKEMNNVESN